MIQPHTRQLLRRPASFTRSELSATLYKQGCRSSWRVDRCGAVFVSEIRRHRPESCRRVPMVIRALRQGTEFVVVVAKSSRTTVERWFIEAGHGLKQVTFVPLPDYVSFTDWAEDGYVSLVDASDESRYLLEPWEFPRAADSLIANPSRNTQPPAPPRRRSSSRAATVSSAAISGSSAKTTLPTASS